MLQIFYHCQVSIQIKAGLAVRKLFCVTLINFLSLIKRVTKLLITTFPSNEREDMFISYLSSCTTKALIAIPRPMASGLQTCRHSSARHDIIK